MGSSCFEALLFSRHTHFETHYVRQPAYKRTARLAYIIHFYSSFDSLELELFMSGLFLVHCKLDMFIFGWFDA